MRQRAAIFAQKGHLAIFFLNIGDVIVLPFFCFFVVEIIGVLKI